MKIDFLGDWFMECIAIDLFCGIGGLTHGVQKAGVNVVAGIDVDPTCKFAYESNNDSVFINKSIEDVMPEELNELYPDNCIKILMGCAPCQTFSNYYQRYQKIDVDEKKWELLYHYIDLIKGTKPDIVTMENVPQLVKKRIFKNFIYALECWGYYVNWNIVDCVNYSVPQRRIRLVLLASIHGDISMIPHMNEKNKSMTVGDAIKYLPAIADGEICANDPLHRASKLSETNKQRIIQSTPGGSWREWDDDIILPCHKRQTGKSYTSIYGRMAWDKPSPTITTQFYNYGSGRFGHPDQQRPISLREGALLQSFPQEYKFFNDAHMQTQKVLGKHIGNAVPVKLGEAIGNSIIDHIYRKVNTDVKLYY